MVGVSFSVVVGFVLFVSVKIFLYIPLPQPPKYKDYRHTSPPSPMVWVWLMRINVEIGNSRGSDIEMIYQAKLNQRDSI